MSQPQRDDLIEEIKLTDLNGCSPPPLPHRATTSRAYSRRYASSHDRHFFKRIQIHLEISINGSLI